MKLPVIVTYNAAYIMHYKVDIFHPISICRNRFNLNLNVHITDKCVYGRVVHVRCQVICNRHADHNEGGVLARSVIGLRDT